MGKFGCSACLAISFNSLVKVVKYPSSATGHLFRAGMLLSISLTLCFVPDEVLVGCAPGGGQPGGP